MPYSALPPELQQKVDSVAFAYEPAVRAGKYEDAFVAYRDLYNLLIKKQPSDERYHKGYPLHNMGIILFLQGKSVEALYYFTLAYVEDLLSEEKGEEDRADLTPAGRTLRQAYQTKEELFTKLKRIALDKKEQGLVVADPGRILQEFAQVKETQIQETQTAVAKMAEAQPKAPPKEKRQPGKFQQVWEKRVFVGGSYKEIAVINEIREAVAIKGYEPVIALDFETPQDLVHHHSLMLLHECKYAIFDLSQEAGQLMEIERARDYEVEKTLAVYQGAGEEPRITEMLKAHLNSLKIPTKSYKDFRELRDHINSFLLDLG